MTEIHDLVVVGAGAAGLAAAHTGRLRGASVCIVQDGPVGGDCTWTGCIPSKTLLAAAAHGASFDEAMARVRATVLDVAASESAAVLREQGIAVIEGRGRLLGEGRVEVGGDVARGRHVILAPGSRPAAPPIPGLTEAGYLTNEQVFDLTAQPRSLVIIGGGPVGCELAQALARLGTQVTLLEREAQLLPRDDVDAAAIVRDALAADGVDVRTGAAVARIAGTADAVAVHLEDGSVIGAARLLVATGRAPSHADMGLDEVGVESTEQGWIEVDEHLRTSVDGVWAVGDAVGRAQLTHAAAHMARLAVDNALGVGIARIRKHRYDPDVVPWVTFTAPEVAQVGRTEAAAADLDGARVAYLPMTEVDRAITSGQTAGFVKLIAAPRRGLGFAGGGRLVGATVVSPTAGETIGEATLALTTGMFTGRLAQSVHAYPTWSFAVPTAAAQFFGTIDGRTAHPVGEPPAERHGRR